MRLPLNAGPLNSSLLLYLTVVLSGCSGDVQQDGSSVPSNAAAGPGGPQGAGGNNPMEMMMGGAGGPQGAPAQGGPMEMMMGAGGPGAARAPADPGMDDMMLEAEGMPGGEAMMRAMMGGQGGGGFPQRGQSAMNAGQRARELVQLPDDLNDWTSEHLRDAVRQRDTRIPEALALRVENTDDHDEMVALLTGLLRVSVGDDEVELPEVAPGGTARKNTGIGSLFRGLFGGGDAGESQEEASKDPQERPAEASEDPPKQDPVRKEKRGGSLFPRGLFPDSAPKESENESFLRQGARPVFLLTSHRPTVSVGDLRSAPRQNNDDDEYGFPRAVALAQIPPIPNFGSDRAGPGPGLDFPAGMPFPGVEGSSVGPPGFPGGFHVPGAAGEAGFGRLPGMRGAGSSGARGSLDDRTLVSAIVRGLITVDSDDAWTAIQEISAGRRESPLDITEAVIVVLEEVLGTEPINEAMAQEILVGIIDESYGNPGSFGVLTALASRTARSALQLPDDAAPSQERNRNTASPASGFFTDMEFTGDMAALGFGGAITAGRGGLPSAQADPVPGKLPVVDVPEDAVSTLAKLFGSSAVHEALRAQIDNVRSLQDAAPLIQLAGTIPNITLRQVTWQVLNDNHGVGAGALIDAGVYQPIVRDPGHLLVLKALPRKRQRRGNSRAVLDPYDPEITWAHATWETLNALRDHLKQAAMEEGLDWDGKQQIRLHRGAIPEVSIRIVIPDASTGEDPAGTQVYYTRCRFTPQSDLEMRKIADHYESRSKGTRRELRDRGVLWFDGVRQGSDGARVTQDVVIQQAQAVSANPAAGFGFAAGSPGAGSTQTFVIETIVVVAEDPVTPE